MCLLLNVVARSEAARVGPPRGPPWCRSTPNPVVAKSGEIPAQSRYGERSSESASPVAGHTVHARTFERKVGRTRAHFRLDPSFDPVRSEGFLRFDATPPMHHLS